MGDPTNVRVAVLGASGFAGGELIRLLQDHPSVDVTFLGAHGSAGKTLGDVHPNLAQLGLTDDLLKELVVADIAQ
jgi:N-acetyl-gamma-glutamylphosphate reductase